MADKKISALTAATTPLAGTEVLPIVQSSATVKVSVADLTTGREVNAYRLITTGEVAIGTTNTGYGKLGVFDTTNALLAVANSTSYAQLQQNGGDLYVNTNAAGAGSGNLIFRFGGAFTTRASINGTSGDITASTGNVIIGTAGKGIDFSANPSAPGMTSELLNDYEEGTWTPVAAGSTTAGVGTYGFQTGSYRKVGSLVYITLFMSWSAHTGTGNGLITGLPFTAGSNAVISIRPNGYPLTLLNVMTGYVAAGGTTIELEQYPSGGGALTSAPLPTSCSLMISACYGV
jgi:hypothetical protein